MSVLKTRLELKIKRFHYIFWWGFSVLKSNSPPLKKHFKNKSRSVISDNYKVSSIEKLHSVPSIYSQVMMKLTHAINCMFLNIFQRKNS